MNNQTPEEAAKEYAFNNTMVSKEDFIAGFKAGQASQSKPIDQSVIVGIIATSMGDNL